MKAALVVVVLIVVIVVGLLVSRTRSALPRNVGSRHYLRVLTGDGRGKRFSPSGDRPGEVGLRRCGIRLTCDRR